MGGQVTSLPHILARDLHEMEKKIQNWHNCGVIAKSWFLKIITCLSISVQTDGKMERKRSNHRRDKKDNYSLKIYLVFFSKSNLGRKEIGFNELVTILLIYHLTTIFKFSLNLLFHQWTKHEMLAFPFSALLLFFPLSSVRLILSNLFHLELPNKLSSI